MSPPARVTPEPPTARQTLDRRLWRFVTGKRFSYVDLAGIALVVGALRAVFG